MPRVLSIDWDYFVEENPMLDWGHAETRLHLDVLWKMRSRGQRVENGQLVEFDRNLSELVPFRGSLSHILNLPCLNNPYRLGFAESHLAILEMLDGVGNLEIVNIDAHHDLGYVAREELRNLRRDIKPTCGNWGEYLIVNKRVTSWKQIYPKWRMKFPEDNSGTFRWARKQLKDRFQVTMKLPKEVVSWSKVDYVFVCRSGAWTPPNYDMLFNFLLASLGSENTIPERSI